MGGPKTTPATLFSPQELLPLPKVPEVRREKEDDKSSGEEKENHDSEEKEKKEVVEFEDDHKHFSV